MPFLVLTLPWTHTDISKAGFTGTTGKALRVEAVEVMTAKISYKKAGAANPLTELSCSGFF